MPSWINTSSIKFRLFCLLLLTKQSSILPDVSVVVSIESQLLISMDRFIAVVFPLKAKLISPKARLISTVWIMPLLVFTFSRIFLWTWVVPPICAFEKESPFINHFMLNSWSAVNPCISFIFNKNYRFWANTIISQQPQIISRRSKSTYANWNNSYL